MTPENDPGDAVIASMQDVLAGEHAALYAYSVIGGRLLGSAEAERADDDYDLHRQRRDTLVGRLRDLGAEPVVAEPGYALPRQVRGLASAAALARQVEDRCAVLYASLVATAAASTRERSFGATSLVASATRALAWGARPSAFPGVVSP